MPARASTATRATPGYRRRGRLGRPDGRGRDDVGRRVAARQDRARALARGEGRRPLGDPEMSRPLELRAGGRGTPALPGPNAVGFGAAAVAGTGSPGLCL